MDTKKQTLNVYGQLTTVHKLSLRVRGENLLVKPWSLVSDEIREIILEHKADLLKLIPTLKQLPEVRHHQVSNWLMLSILKARREKRFDCEFYSLTGPSVLLQAVNHGGFSFVDHWGSTASGDFVCEPYGDFSSPKLIESVDRFCKTFEVYARLQPESLWYPGSTCRITFRPEVKS